MAGKAGNIPARLVESFCGGGLGTSSFTIQSQQQQQQPPVQPPSGQIFALDRREDFVSILPFSPIYFGARVTNSLQMARLNAAVELSPAQADVQSQEGDIGKNNLPPQFI